MSKIIVITGPESTAKSSLTRELATCFNGSYFPEYAREYLVAKGNVYNFSDVEQIARQQIEQYKSALALKSDLVFLDTWLIITKVWFEWVFGEVPDWLEKAIADYRVDLFLLCRPDIPWEPDPLREHGADNEREQLFLTYKNELISRGFLFAEIGGYGKSRIFNAVKAIEEFTGYTVSDKSKCKDHPFSRK